MTTSSNLLPEPAAIYTTMRNLILGLQPHEAGIFPTPTAPMVWGVLMETGYDQGIITLVCLADGTTSLYFSSGGGIIGSGEALPVARASRRVVEAAEGFLKGLPPVEGYPLPQTGQAQFILLTFGGPHITQADEQDLGYGRHALSPLFYCAQEVISQVRRLQESQPAQTPPPLAPPPQAGAPLAGEGD